MGRHFARRLLNGLQGVLYPELFAEIPWPKHSILGN